MGSGTERDLLRLWLPVFPLHGITGDNPLLAEFFNVNTVDQLFIRDGLAEGAFVQPPEIRCIPKSDQTVKRRRNRRSAKAFHFSIPREIFQKAAVITLLAAMVVVVGTWVMAALEPQLRLMDVLFEVTSAFGTVGLSTRLFS